MLHMFFRDNETACMIEPTTQVGSIGDQVKITWGGFQAIPLTLTQAEQQGWQSSQECVIDQGIYASKTDDYPIRLMFNLRGDIIGMEISSVHEQNPKLWVQDPEQNTWLFHLWFQSPETACQE